MGLLCLNGAKLGGQSQFISAYALHNDLLENDPDALHTLYQTFFFDRRSQQEEGELPYLSAPVFRWDGRELHIRYLHYYTQVGHERAGQPLTAAQQHALAAVETRLERPDIRVEFTLQPGQMIFWNNHWLLHNRTAFEDYPEIERRRHLKRLWLRQRSNLRQLWTLCGHSRARRPLQNRSFPRKWESLPSLHGGEGPGGRPRPHHTWHNPCGFGPPVGEAPQSPR